MMVVWCWDDHFLLFLAPGCPQHGALAQATQGGEGRKEVTFHPPLPLTLPLPPFHADKQHALFRSGGRERERPPHSLLLCSTKNTQARRAKSGWGVEKKERENKLFPFRRGRWLRWWGWTCQPGGGGSSGKSAQFAVPSPFLSLSLPLPLSLQQGFARRGEKLKLALFATKLEKSTSL